MNCEKGTLWVCAMYLEDCKSCYLGITDDLDAQRKIVDADSLFFPYVIELIIAFASSRPVHYKRQLQKAYRKYRVWNDSFPGHTNWLHFDDIKEQGKFLKDFRICQDEAVKEEKAECFIFNLPERNREK